MDNKNPQSVQSSIQALNKAKEKKDAAEETAKTRCKICFKEIAPQRRCGGHGGGGGGGSSGSSDTASEEKKRVDQTSPTISKPGQPVDSDEALVNFVDEDEVSDEDINSEMELADERFNPELIAKLVEDEKLLIEHDPESGVITIKLQCDPKSLSDEQKSELKKFVGAIIEELEAFKKENGITNDCKKIEQDKEGNILSLRVALPTPKLYDAFIQRLANNLLPSKKPEQQQRTGLSSQVSVNEFNPTPLSRTLTPDANKKTSLVDKNAERDVSVKPATKANSVDEEAQTTFNPTPFSTKPKMGND